nr:ABCB8 protein [Diaphanosoma celebensis]
MLILLNSIVKSQSITLGCRLIYGFRSPSIRTVCRSQRTVPKKTLSKAEGSAVFFLGTGFAASCKFFSKGNTALCESSISRVSTSQETSPPKFDWTRFWKLLKPHWFKLVIAITSAFIVAVLNIEIPRALGSIVNIVTQFLNEHGENLTQRYWEQLAPSAARLSIMYIAQALFTFVYIHTLACVGERVAAQLRKDLFTEIIKQDIVFFDRHRTGELVNRLTADVQDFKSSFKQCISQGLRSITQTVGCIVSMYWISPTLTLYTAAIVPSVIGVGSYLGAFLRAKSREAQAQIARATEVCDEAIGNIRTVRAFAMESQEEQLYSQEVEKAAKMQEKLGLGIGLFQAGANLFLNGIVLGTVGLGGSLMTSGQLRPGDLMAFLVCTQTIQRSLSQMSLLFGSYVRGTSAGSRVFEYCNLEPTIPLHGGRKIPFHSLMGDIEFRNVSFAYPSRPEQTILNDFSLKIPGGRMVALVGSSGGGKSTVASLLERFYDVQGGEITLDGQDIRSLDPSWLRGRAIGFINQEPILFATSILENIRYGKPSASDQEVIEAAKLANADEFIRSFPRGYQTIVGERGVTISGGQKQRIAIARALLKNPSILILDEATSALDAESERVVQEALDKVAAGRTVLIVAHRLSTVRNAHLIAVVANGTIAEMGTHESLSKSRGLYWQLIRQQEQQEQKEQRSSA